jgi:hypothetical protein
MADPSHLQLSPAIPAAESYSQAPIQILKKMNDGDWVMATKAPGQTTKKPNFASAEYVEQWRRGKRPRRLESGLSELGQSKGF